jgi:hypothetical protein
VVPLVGCADSLQDAGEEFVEKIEEVVGDTADISVSPELLQVDVVFNQEVSAQLLKDTFDVVARNQFTYQYTDPSSWWQTYITYLDTRIVFWASDYHGAAVGDLFNSTKFAFDRFYDAAEYVITERPLWVAIDDEIWAWRGYPQAETFDELNTIINDQELLGQTNWPDFLDSAGVIGCGPNNNPQPATKINNENCPNQIRSEPLIARKIYRQHSGNLLPEIKLSTEESLAIFEKLKAEASYPFEFYGKLWYGSNSRAYIYREDWELQTPTKQQVLEDPDIQKLQNSDLSNFKQIWISVKTTDGDIIINKYCNEINSDCEKENDDFINAAPLGTSLSDYFVQKQYPH